MRLFIVSIITVMLIGAGLSSCSTLTSVGKSTPSVEMRTQLNLDMEDMEYLGMASGSSVQSYVLGLPIGGRRKYYGKVGIYGPSLNNGLGTRGYNNALYDALTSKPDADFILPISVSYKVERSFLGKKVTLQVKGKAFKIKEYQAGLKKEQSEMKMEQPEIKQDTIK